jgi:hypothetical protein
VRPRPWRSRPPPRPPPRSPPRPPPRPPPPPPSPPVQRLRADATSAPSASARLLPRAKAHARGRAGATVAGRTRRGRLRVSPPVAGRPGRARAQASRPGAAASSASIDPRRLEAKVTQSAKDPDDVRRGSPDRWRLPLPPSSLQVRATFPT